MKAFVKSSFNRLPLRFSSALYGSLKGVPLETTHPEFARLLEAGTAVGSRLAALDINSLSVSDYSKEYLHDIRTNTAGCLTKFVGVLSYALPPVLTPNIQFLDYGAGTGLISLIAAELGIQVTFNDLFDVSCQDFREISKRISPEKSFHIVSGDIHAVVADSKARGVLYDAVGSYDVIEHIYRPEEFYAEIPKVLKPGACVYMATSANSYNPKTVQELARVQDIWEGGPGAAVAPNGTATYFEVRRQNCERISERAGLKLSKSQIEDIAARTKGLIVPDLETRFTQFVQNPKLSTVDTSFPSNACHPNTGNWTEHLLNYPEFLKALPTQTWASTAVFPKSDGDRARFHVIGVLTQKSGM